MVLSLTHGAAGRRQHIWTFASGLTEVSSSLPFEDCPCDISRYTAVPALILLEMIIFVRVAFTPNGLLILCSTQMTSSGMPCGQDCTCTANSTCCELNNPPWFTKNLPTVTTVMTLN